MASIKLVSIKDIGRGKSRLVLGNLDGLVSQKDDVFGSGAVLYSTI